MAFTEELAMARKEMKEKIVRICEEERLVGRLVRNFGIAGKVEQTWGIATALRIEDGMLLLQAGEREDYGHEPFESSISLDSAHFYENEEAAFITGGSDSEWREWKFFSRG